MPTTMQQMLPSSDSDTFLACLDCLVLEPLGKGARQRMTSSRIPAPELQSIPTNDSSSFLQNHQRHRSTCLHRCSLQIRRDQNWNRRSEETSFAASDGKQLFVVTGQRHPHGNSLVYEIRPGTLQPKEFQLAVDDDTIHRALTSVLFPYQLRQSAFRRFMAVLQELLRAVSLQDLDLFYESASDPSTGIARLPDGTFHELSARCQDLFEPWENARIQEFLAREQEQASLLALRVRRELVALNA